MTPASLSMCCNQTAIFLHVPKTAGSTLLSIFKYQYKGKNNYFLEGSNPEKSKLELSAQKDKNNLDLIFGHTDFGIHEQCCRDKYKYFAFLRHPVERIISHYFYVKNSPNHYLHGLVDMTRLSLNEYISSGLTNELNNGQVRMLIGGGGFHQNLYSRYNIPYGANENWMLEEAKRNIEAYFGFVGVQEEFNTSVLLLKKILQWDKPLFFRSLNKTGQKIERTQLDAATISTIIKYNELDLQLYHWVQGNFSLLKREHRQYLTQAHIRLNFNNWLYGQKQAMTNLYSSR